MSTAIWLVIVTMMTFAGDYCIKIASGQSGGIATPVFALGAVLYGLPALGWYYLMQSHSLATVGVFYSTATLLLLAALGVLVFKEPFGLRDALGISLAVAAVLVMSTQ